MLLDICDKSIRSFLICNLILSTTSQGATTSTVKVRANLDDEQKIISPEFHKDVAKKIHAGLQDWLKRVER